jgi:hypothetical protein
MRLRTLACFAATAAIVAFIPLHAMAGPQDFELVNSTGYEIKNVYVSPTTSSDWGDDILGEDTLADGDSQQIKFPASRGDACEWDIKVTYQDDTSHQWTDVNLCSISKLTIHYDEGTHDTTASSE